MRSESNFKLMVIGAMALALVVAAAWFLGRRLEGGEPSVTIESPVKFVGRNFVIKGRAVEKGMGLKSLKVSMVSADGRSSELLSETWATPGFGKRGQMAERSFAVAVTPVSLGFSEGAATITVVATDHSYRGWGSGNKAVVTLPVTIDTASPVVSVLTNAHYVNQGGVGFVIYRVSEKAKESGVRVGDNFFAGYPGLFAHDDKIYGCFFALAFNQGPDTTMMLEAMDEAGNRSAAGFPYRIRPKRFRSDSMNISEKFLAGIFPKFPDVKPGSGVESTPLNRFLAINRDLRNSNYRELAALGAKSAPKILWEGVFGRMANAAPMAQFADHRAYVLDGKVADEQDHLGADLASLSMSPVAASNAGKVVMAKDLGIYGLTVAIDHGFGLVTHYSHLSRIDVKVGDVVKKDQIIAASGATGLAGGDHLHYGFLVGNTFVNPIEWWDAHWIKDNVTSKIASVAAATGGTGGK
ncbi:MAG: M23 family metallopeptidase [Deltaproteobacteria bacterium]|nr:M23 family metallopeptidase [Deltaproteobacteria bacterium]